MDVRNPGKAMTIYDIAKILGYAFPLAFTPTNIKSVSRFPASIRSTVKYLVIMHFYHHRSQTGYSKHHMKMFLTLSPCHQAHGQHEQFDDTKCSPTGISCSAATTPEWTIT